MNFIRSASVKRLFQKASPSSETPSSTVSTADVTGVIALESDCDTLESDSNISRKLADADVASEKKSSMEGKSELDLVFVVDNTGSMDRWIKSAQKNIQSIVRKIVASEAKDVRFALVSYRDHPPQDTSFVTKTHNFTDNVSCMQQWVDEMRAQGGGDFPEAVADGLYDCLNLDFRPNSTKIAVVIADAPPHGLGVFSDGFPNGCPLGHDPLVIVRTMAAKGITIYSVICGNFEGQGFYQGIAQITGGQYIPLSSAHLLADVIVGGAQEEITLERLMQDAQNIVDEEEQMAGRELDEDELAPRLESAFKKKSATVRRTQFGGTDLPDFEVTSGHYSTAKTIADLRNKGGRAHLSHGTYGAGMDARPSASGKTFAAASSSGVSYAQCKRMTIKAKARKCASSTL